MPKTPLSYERLRRSVRSVYTFQHESRKRVQVMLLKCTTSVMATLREFDLVPAQCWYDGAAVHTLVDGDSLTRKEVMLNAACVDVHRGHSVDEWQRTGFRLRKYVVEKGFVCTADRAGWALILQKAVSALYSRGDVLLMNLCANWNGEVRGLPNVPMFLIARDTQGSTTHLVVRFGSEEVPDNTTRLDQCTEAERQHAVFVEQQPVQLPPPPPVLARAGH